MGHIFISYSKKDIVYAEKLINALRREGFNPWLDMQSLQAGTYWPDRLHAAIKGCDAYILIMSRNAKKSQWVPEELVVAKSKGKPIFPLRLDGTELFLGIQTVQAEDVRDGALPPEAFYQRLAKVTTRRRKASQKVDSVHLTDKIREQKADAAAEKASYLISKISSNVKDAIAIASKVSSTTYNSVANSDMVKNISSKLKKKPKPVKKKKK
jgi:hypothetical protein